MKGKCLSLHFKHFRGGQTGKFAYYVGQQKGGANWGLGRLNTSQLLFILQHSLLTQNPILLLHEFSTLKHNP